MRSLAKRSPKKVRPRVKEAERKGLVVSHKRSFVLVDAHVEEVVVPHPLVPPAQEDAGEEEEELVGGVVGGLLFAYPSATVRKETKQKQRRESRMVDRSCESEESYTSSRATSSSPIRMRKVMRRLMWMAIYLEVRSCLL
jgi:hypothetical protein